MQEFRPLESGVTRFDELYGCINGMFEVLRSQFSGNQFPSNPSVGQPCYRVDMTPPRLFLFNGKTWDDPTDLSPVVVSHSQELEDARGSAASLEARLDVAMLQDGTLRGAPPAGGWWAREAGAVERVSENQFKVAGDRRAVYTKRRAVMLEQDKDGQSWVVDCFFKNDVTLVTLEHPIIDTGLTEVCYGQDVGSEPAVPDILPPLGQVGQCLGVKQGGKDGGNEMAFIDAVPLTGKEGQILMMQGGKLVWGNLYEMCEVYLWSDPTLKPGFLPAFGGLITNAAENYPEAWAYLQTATGKKRCTTETQWQEMTRAIWHTNADGSEVGWEGIGGAPLFAPNFDTGDLRLPDLRGMYAEAAGFDSLGVGEAHGDGIRPIEGYIDLIRVKLNNTFDAGGAFSGELSTASADHNGGSARTAKFILDTKLTLPASNKFQPRAYGVLPCVFLGPKNTQGNTP